MNLAKKQRREFNEPAQGESELVFIDYKEGCAIFPADDKTPNAYQDEYSGGWVIKKADIFDAKVVNMKPVVFKKKSEHNNVNALLDLNVEGANVSLVCIKDLLVASSGFKKGDTIDIYLSVNQKGYTYAEVGLHNGGKKLTRLPAFDEASSAFFDPATKEAYVKGVIDNFQSRSRAAESADGQAVTPAEWQVAEDKDKLPWDR